MSGALTGHSGAREQQGMYGQLVVWHQLAHQLRRDQVWQQGTQQQCVGLLELFEKLFETNVAKIVKVWPGDDCPKFQGTPGEEARDWLIIMTLVLGGYFVQICQLDWMYWYQNAG
ncbi:hypothetical protein PCASD_23292 [Puccinia coronata f. sp. avenae]|uniref:Uncharacterized protein n=1 Tax=Puccinia coronata f. sp. avenae TaxID=200324 RepID=A0A2N5TMM7_9BASI|nr:hypothetical protein PCASD_23292 [Puccinia coronata f. sp. avenae]